MFDFRLPKPFLDPMAWKIPEGEIVLVDLRFFFTSGGPYRKKLEAVRDLAFAKSAMSPGQEAVVMDALKKSGRPETLARDLDSSAPTSFDWANEVFDSSRHHLDEIAWRRLIQDYIGLRGGEVTVLDDLRLLPAFAKKKAPDAATALEHELAKALALYSPQVENPEPGANLALNPTIQLATGGTMKGYFRSSGEVIDASIDWQQAAVIDEFHEHGKQPSRNLLASLEFEHGDSKLVKTRSFEQVLLEMTRVGLLISLK